MMNPVVKGKWLQALRSGEFNQARRFLRTPEGFCCLGVLCELHRREKASGPAWIEHPFLFGAAGSKSYYGTSFFLPLEVQRWAGLPMDDPFHMEGAQRVHLSMLNDNKGCSFEEIADVIEENY